jgi:hypothetical protein
MIRLLGQRRWGKAKPKGGVSTPHSEGRLRRLRIDAAPQISIANMRGSGPRRYEMVTWTDCVFIIELMVFPDPPP